MSRKVEVDSCVESRTTASAGTPPTARKVPSDLVSGSNDLQIALREHGEVGGTHKIVSLEMALFFHLYQCRWKSRSFEMSSPRDQSSHDD
jgi:hypothetical protein